MLQTQDLNDIDVSRYEPIGIVVIPAEHDVYGAGECGVVSIEYIPGNEPQKGLNHFGSQIEDFYIDFVGYEYTYGKYKDDTPFDSWVSGNVVDCCKEYSTSGTNKGDWFLPFGSELLDIKHSIRQ